MFFVFAGVRQLIDDKQSTMLATTENVPLFARGHDRRHEFGVAARDERRPSRSRGALARRRPVGRRHAPAVAICGGPRRRGVPHRRRTTARWRGAPLLAHQGSTTCHGECGSPDTCAPASRSAASACDFRERRGEQRIGACRGDGGKQRGLVARDETRVDRARCKRVVRHDTLQEGNVGRDADDLVLGERLLIRLQRRGAVLAVDDQLGDHRVVVRRDRVPRANAGVHAHRGARRPAREGGRACRSTAGNRARGPRRRRAPRSRGR